MAQLNLVLRDKKKNTFLRTYEFAAPSRHVDRTCTQHWMYREVSASTFNSYYCDDFSDIFTLTKNQFYF